jgi:hypothetical protein
MSVKPVVAAALALALAGTAPISARAELTGELAPSVAVGVTTNAQANAARARDEITTLGVFGNLRARSPRTSHVLGAQVSYTHYWEGLGVDTLSSALTYSSAYQLSREWDFQLGAGAALSRTSRLDLIALASGGPQAATTGTALFLATNATQGVAYQPSAAWRFSQNAAVNRIDYLSTTNLVRRPATTVAGGLRIDYVDRRNGYSLEGRVVDLIADPAAATSTAPAMPRSHSVLVETLAGWRRELSLEWTTQLQAGAAMLFDQNRPDIVVPAGRATVEYRRQLWFATLSAARTPVANMFTALATINDQVFLNLTLPLSRSELWAIGGFAGLVHARVVGPTGELVSAFDQRSAGARVGKRFKELPLVAALEYSVIDQDGSAGGFVSLVRHLLMFHIAGTFQFGPGTPPIIGGGLYQAAPPR